MVRFYPLEAIGRREAQVTWRAREGAQAVIARDVVALIKEVIRIQLELYIAHLIVESRIEEDIARVGDYIGTAADLS